MAKIIFGLFLVIGTLLLMVKAFVFGFGDEILTTGHVINMERPQFVDKRLLRFLSEHQASGRTSAPS